MIDLIILMGLVGVVIAIVLAIAFLAVMWSANGGDY